MEREIYISDGTWFDNDAICILLDDYRPKMNSGLFLGFRTCVNPSSENKTFGERYLDEEVCSFDEFTTVIINRE